MKRIILVILGLVTFSALEPVSAQDDCALPSQLFEDRPARIIAPAGVNVRARTDADSELLGRFVENTILEVYKGPVCDGGFNWWLVGDNFLIGWVVEGMDEEYWLQPYRENRTSGLEGVALTFDEFLFGSASFGPVEAGQANNYFAYPSHIEVLFYRYPIDRPAFASAQIRVYSVSEYLEANPDIQEEIDKFEAVMVDRSPVAHYFAEDGLPEIPNESVAHTFPSQLEYIDFNGGSGFRYITLLTQNYSPPGSGQSYIFQGMTSDRAYYVSAIFPVRIPTIKRYQYPDGVADGSEVMGRTIHEYDPTNGQDSYEIFQAGARYVLDNFTPDMFEPDLRDLDAMMASLVVEGP